MTFKLVLPETIDVTADVHPPDGSGAEAGQIKLKLRYLSLPERRELIAELQSSTDEKTTDAGLAARLVVGWDGLQDEDGEPIPWGASSLASAMEIPYFHDAVRNAIAEHLYGARAKNFFAPDGNGPPALPE